MTNHDGPDRPVPDYSFSVISIAARNGPICVWFVLIFLLAAVHPGQAQVTAKVIGGKDAENNEYPWMAALVYREHESVADGQFCGGILINSNWVLTAAHCVRDRDLADFVIAIGDENLNDTPRLIAPRLVLLHPAGYNRTTRGGDLALIQLSETLTDLEPLEYRRSSDQQALPHSGRIMGWGRTGAEEQPNSPRMSNLQVADVPIHNFEDSILIEYGFSEIMPEYIPTGQISPPKGASQGDSGGPLLVRGSGNGEWILAGIDSWGKSYTSEAAAISMFTVTTQVV